MGKERSQVPANLKWRVEDIFENVEEWNKVYDEVAEKLDFSQYEGKLSDPELLLECLEGVNAVAKDLGLLGLYAFMRHDEDTRSSEFSALLSRLDILEMKLMGNIAYMTEEIFTYHAGKEYIVSITLENSPQKIEINVGGSVGGWE
jgi:oligoendopeptidase F